MPMDQSAGYSAVTPRKLIDLAYIVGTWINLTRGPKFRGAAGAHPEFLYWDLNPGPGRVNGEPGSPLVFLDVARSCGDPFRAWFHERHEGSLASLRDAVGTGWDGRVSIVPGDHTVTVPDVLRIDARRIPRRAYGLAFADPNGRDDLPIVPLQAIAKRFPYVDFVLNVGAMSWKRIRSVGKPGRFLHEDLAQVPKRHILIRRPVGSWQFAMFLCTNYYNAPRLKKRGFWDIRSLEGQEILRKLDLLPGDYQPPLFDPDALRPIAPIVNIADIRATESSEPAPSLDAAASASAATKLA